MSSKTISKVAMRPKWAVVDIVLTVALCRRVDHH